MRKDLAGEIKDWKRAWDAGRCACADDSEVPAHDHSDEAEAAADLEVVVGVCDAGSGGVHSKLVVCGGCEKR